LPRLERLKLALVMLFGLGVQQAAACVCAPLAEEFWPAFGVDVPRAVRPLIIQPSGNVEAYRLLDLGPDPSGTPVDLGPSRPEDPSRPSDLGPVPADAREVEISRRRLETRSGSKTPALELVPSQLLASNHRYVVATSGRVRATFLTGDLLEAPPGSFAAPRLTRIKYPLPGGPRSFRTSCDTGSVSVVYLTGPGPKGAPRLFGIWAPSDSDGPPLAFSRTMDSELDLGRPGVCGFYGLLLDPGSHVDLILRERLGGGFGAPIRVRLDIPPA
jgi:hypothetical protein